MFEILDMNTSFYPEQLMMIYPIYHKNYRYAWFSVLENDWSKIIVTMGLRTLQESVQHDIKPLCYSNANPVCNVKHYLQGYTWYHFIQ